MTRVLQALSFVVLVFLATFGALELDRRLAGCDATVLHFAGAKP